MDRDPENKALMSLRLARVMDDIGVNRLVVKRRRETYLQRENIETMVDHLKGFKTTNFHFGSQSEGSTTLGMRSDIDQLKCTENINIILNLTDWEYGVETYLMVKEGNTPPQHYWLQYVREDSPEPNGYYGQEDGVPYEDGRVFLSNRLEKKDWVRFLGNRCVISGPSVSYSEEWDYVFALKCKQLPPEVEWWLQRPRSSHWPTREMMQDARECSCFLVPDGHFQSLNEGIEWRISPNQIERILVFSFTTVQLKCYVVFKMLKKYLNEHYLGHHGKLTSFHCKTIMFFTIERISPAEWKEDRLIKCISYCLHTLLTFLKRGYCPHFILSGVNLFEGKISRCCQISLMEIVKVFLKNNLMILYDLQIDSLGQRIQTPSSDMLEPRSALFKTINNVLACDLIEHVSFKLTFCIHAIANDELNPAQFRRLFNEFAILDDDNIINILGCYERYALSLLKPHVFSLVASIVSSSFIEHNIPFKPEIYHLYERSFDTDVTSSRLKLASMLYCNADYLKAGDVLSDIELRYSVNVHAICGCKRKFDGDEPELLSENTVHDWNYNTALLKVALCVRFTRLEAFCVPTILLCEMNRAVNDDVQFRRMSEFFWMDMAVVDSRPYLFYLQYLTYGKLDLRLRQEEALSNLEKCVINRDMGTLNHPETGINLLGHCWELEGYHQKALQCYIRSVFKEPRNNAANWHIRRLTGNRLRVFVI
ncbi:uncharacterized protein LOC128235370 [Mya arenaria]|uniref:uncharacterized protein LOC128235370 n=1 Tax=Mya arenaria TaxID=6604 RepID=UPI0022E26091|nr:uncharacterized protein LOC128235370 [Mya arenaria]